MRRTLPLLVLAAVVAGCSTGPTVDAPTAAADLATAGVVADVATTTAQDDPNQLLGRPGGYTSRATFTIPGVEPADPAPAACDRGGCIEQWPDEAAAQERADYITQIGKALPGAVEYSYVRDGLLLRVAKAADPATAQRVADAFLGE